MRKTILTLMVLVAAPAMAQTAGKNAKLAGDDLDKKVCRREVATGSIMPGKRTCHTVAEWRAIDDQNEKANDAFRNSRPTSATGSVN